MLTYFLTDNLGVAALAAGLIVTLAKIWDVVIDPLIGAGGPALRNAGSDPILGYLLMGIAAGVVIGIGMLIAAKTAGPYTESGPASVPPASPWRDQYLSGFRALRCSQPFSALLGTFLLQALATGTMLAGAQYIATWVLRSEDAVTFVFVALVGPALLATPAWTFLARRLGKERAFAIASALFTVAATTIIAAVWVPGAWIYASVAVAGGAYAGMQSLPMAMLPDVVSHDERVSGPGQAGTFTGIWTAGETAGETVGFALGATTVSLTLATTGYVSSVAGASVEQPDAAITGIVLSFSILPAALMAASLVALRRYGLRCHDIDVADAPDA